MTLLLYELLYSTWLGRHRKRLGGRYRLAGSVKNLDNRQS
jgi:hypothetical protein